MGFEIPSFKIMTITIHDMLQMKKTGRLEMEQLALNFGDKPHQRITSLDCNQFPVFPCRQSSSRSNPKGSFSSTTKMQQCPVYKGAQHTPNMETHPPTIRSDKSREVYILTLGPGSQLLRSFSRIDSSLPPPSFSCSEKHGSTFSNMWGGTFLTDTKSCASGQEIPGYYRIIQTGSFAWVFFFFF